MHSKKERMQEGSLLTIIFEGLCSSSVHYSFLSYLWRIVRCETEICLSRPRNKVKQTFFIIFQKMVGLLLVIYTIVQSLKKNHLQQIQEICVILLADFCLTIPMFTSSVRCYEVVNHGNQRGPSPPSATFLPAKKALRNY